MDENEIVEIVQGAIDAPRGTDYLWSDMFGYSIDIPESLAFVRSPVQDQSIGRDPSTLYACTCFSLSHCINEGNVLEGTQINTSGEQLWSNALAKGAGLNSGWYLQSALDMGRDLGHISGYSKCSTPDECVQALASGKMIYTGSNRCNWAETERTLNFTPGTSYGHAFCIVGYDNKEKYLIARNSYGSARFDKGHFKIPFDCFQYLFTSYAILDNTSVDLLSKVKLLMDEKMIQKVIDAGIYNGKDGDRPVTRREVAIMLGRILTKLENENV